MKIFTLCFLVLITGCIAVSAQPTVTLLTFESYTFSDQFSAEYGEGKIGDGFQWGGGLEFGLSETTAIEVIYQTMKADVSYYGLDTNLSPKLIEGSSAINYMLVGGTRFAPLNEKVSAFGTINMGVGWSNPSDELQSDGFTRFSVGARLGLRIMVSEKVSLRAHGQVISPVQWAGGGMYFGTGGTGAGVSTGSTTWQFNLGGSLNFRLK